MCLIEILHDYLSGHKLIVSVDDTRSSVLEVTSDVPQCFLLGPLLFCVFINDLPDEPNFSDPYFFAHDLKILSVNKNCVQVQLDFDSIDT